MNPLPKRLHSIDVFRAITMLLMIFVNDVSSVQQIPAWIDHVDAAADGLGFADTVFPAFLFIVGLSLPFAIKNRMKKEEPFSKIALYIITRSLALLVMGFFHVNGENYPAAAALPKSVLDNPYYRWLFPDLGRLSCDYCKSKKIQFNYHRYSFTGYDGFSF